MRLALCCLAGLLCPLAVAADDRASSGDFSATFQQTPNSGTAVHSDLDYSFGGRGLQPGVTLGLERRSGRDDRIIFGSVGIGIPALTVRLGRPRLALQNGRDPVLPLQTAETGTLTFGVSASGTTATYTYAASWHRTEAHDSIYGLRAGYAGDMVSVYGGVLGGSAERMELGSAITYGAATAGVDLAIEERTDMQSRIFVDYDVSDALTLGIVGRQDDFQDTDATMGLGVTAAYDIGSGFLKGGVARAPEGSPLLGVSVGFQF